MKNSSLPRLFEPFGIEPFDVLFKNFFDQDSFFSPVFDAKIKYPCDIQVINDTLFIEIAVPGIDKEEIEISKIGGVLRVKYNNYSQDRKDKAEEKNGDNYIQRSIAKRSFSFGWRISDMFDMSKAEATLDKGLLMISIPKNMEKKIMCEKIEIQ
jgi:HSP20 family molecular chaperone IbpA